MTEVEIAVVKTRTPAYTNVKANDVERQTSTVSIKSTSTSKRRQIQLKTTKILLINTTKKLYYSKPPTLQTLNINLKQTIITRLIFPTSQILESLGSTDKRKVFSCVNSLTLKVDNTLY